MSLKAGRVGVNPSQVNPVDGSIISSATSGYTKQEADAKFLTQTDAASTYESKSDAITAYTALQPKTLAVPISMLQGSLLVPKTTVEDVIQTMDNAMTNLELTQALGGGEVALSSFVNAKTVNDTITLSDSYKNYNKITFICGRNNASDGIQAVTYSTKALSAILGSSTGNLLIPIYAVDNNVITLQSVTVELTSEILFTVVRSDNTTYGVRQVFGVI